MQETGQSAPVLLRRESCFTFECADEQHISTRTWWFGLKAGVCCALFGTPAVGFPALVPGHHVPPCSASNSNDPAATSTSTEKRGRGRGRKQSSRKCGSKAKRGVE